jgi:hypothetical protein
LIDKYGIRERQGTGDAKGRYFGMDKPTINLIGHKLRREFKPPDDLPYPMQMALKALALQPVRDGDNDNDIRHDEIRRSQGELSDDRDQR